MLLYLFLFITNFMGIWTAVDFVPSSTIPRSKRDILKSILDENKCSELRNICGNVKQNDDLLILECLFSTSPELLKKIGTVCQHIIWDHTRQLIQDDSVQKLLNLPCGSELQRLDCRANSGHYLKCIMNNFNDIQNPQCTQILLRLENVAFSDHEWISSFLEQCTDDINNNKCGRFNNENFSQQNTLICLQDHILSVKDECKKEVFRLSELQSNNIRLDAQLYIDCANDQSRYCSQYIAGNGRIIPCLMQQLHTDPTRIDPKCLKHLFRRQKLIAQDYRVSKGLIKACKEDIKKTHCRKQISSDKTVRLAQILLCLENFIKNGTKVDPECEAEMTDHRKMLMEDYRLSPEIVNNCKNETQMYCKGFAIGGKTIHCLMQLGLRQNNAISKLSVQCLRSLEDLIQQADIGENWNVDPVLHEACDPVVKVACRGLPSGNARTFTCLMDNRNSEAMTEECENALLEIQYFVARDFKLDPQLYKSCKQDASKFCHYFEGVKDIEGPSYKYEVFPCLYRYAYLRQDDQMVDDRKLLQKECVQHIQRVMRQRALSVDLHPEIEEVCLRDLSDYCQDKSKRGEEMQCLQDNLDDLEPKCQEAVESFTEIEAQHVELNPYIAKYCGQIINNLCNEDLSDDNGDIMECMIEHKNNPIVKANPSCRGSIEHFQIISLKDIKFTYKFKVACKSHAMRLCKNHASTRNEVITCLSESILNATVHGMKSPIPKDCRQQLRAQILQQREKIDFDPELKKACAEDINNFCKTVRMENAQVLECLQMQPNKNLSQKCGKQIFKIQQLEVYDNNLDYALQTMCAEAIDLFCSQHNKETIFNCLKTYKDAKGFNKRCRSIVMHRLIEQNSNNLLNPTLQQNCNLDIKKYCKNELATSDESTIGDSIIKCLKKQFKVGKLTVSCEKEVADILRDRTLNIALNQVIQVACKNELDTICKFDDDDAGKVEECLKFSFINKNIASVQCKQEIANMIQESEADIHVDPILQNVCSSDLVTFCSDVQQGNGRLIQCLRTILERGTQSLSLKCKTKLTERIEMYKSSAQYAPIVGFQELYNQVNSSPIKNYFAIVFLMVVGAIFLIGLVCGRISRRNYRLLKNK